MKKILPRHDVIIKENIEKFGGRVIKHTGDGIFAIFEDGEPLQCALAIQKMFEKEDWGTIGELRIRIGLHAGYAEKRADDYFGPVINRTARIMAVAWGGQIILTPAVASATKLPVGATLEDLGVHLLKDLTEPQQIFGLTHPDLKLKEFPPLRSLSSHSHNLAIQTTPFLGRENELVEIGKLLENPSCRLLTIIGPGGIGKTRLAIQSAAEKIEGFTHGVYFIPLAPLSSVDFLISAIAEALKFSFYSSQDEKIQILNYLREKEMLLIMDNFEHLAEGAGVIADILNTAAKVKILVTSRELLNLSGEWVIQIEGLKVPEGEKIDIEGYSGVQLFLYNAKRINANISLSNDDKHYMVRICQLVGGMPLGIEIASSWLRTLSCKEIAQEIEKNLDFLVTSMRDVPERHRSLRAVFEYSWNLISSQEREVLKKLSLFRGGFHRAAAEQVAGASLSILSSLVDKSLLRRNSFGRYEVIEVLRPYAEEKLGSVHKEHEKVYDLHCGYYADFLQRRERDFKGPRHKDVLKEICEEIENIRAAWNWAANKVNLEKISKAIVSFASYLDVRGLFHEGNKTFGQAVAVLQKVANGPAKDILYSKALTRHAIFCYRIGDYEKSRILLQEALLILRKFDVKSEVALCLMTLGNIDNLLGNYEESKKVYEESLKIYKNNNDRKGILGVINNLGVIDYYCGEYKEAKKLFEESLQISREIGYEPGVATALGNIGLVSHGLGNYDEAKELINEGLEIERKAGDKIGIAGAIHNLGLTYSELGDNNKAKMLYEEALAMRREIGDRMGISVSLNNLGNLLKNLGNYAEARRFHEESLSIRKELNDIRGVSQSFVNLGRLFTAMEKFNEAQEYFDRAITTALETKEISIVFESLFGITEILNEKRQKKRCLEILTFLTNQEITDINLREKVNKLLNEVESKFSSQMLSRIRKGAKAKKLEEVLKEIKTT